MNETRPAQKSDIELIEEADREAEVNYRDMLSEWSEDEHRNIGNALASIASELRAQRIAMRPSG